jgi:hypothetical protein
MGAFTPELLALTPKAITALILFLSPRAKNSGLFFANNSMIA